LGCLEGYHHHGVQVGQEWVYRNPTVPARLSDDEIAAVDCLLRMGANVRAGPVPDPAHRGIRADRGSGSVESAGLGRLTQTAAKP